jgi:outer membrane protein insertion porin family
VDEGEPYRVGRLRIEGFQRQPDPNDSRLSLDVPSELIVPEDELLALCDLAPGDILTQYEIELDQRDIVRRYGEIGHIAHGSMPFYERFEFLEPQLVFDAEENRVDVVYRLAQGAPQYIREIQIEGNTRTRDRVIRREFADLFEGGRADLAKIERGIARLRGSGYFSMVGPAAAGHRDPTFRFVETSDSRWKDLVVVVEEGSQIRFDFGVEWSPDSGLAGRIGVTFQNFDISRWPSWEHPWDDVRSGRAFRGAGQTLRLFASPGTDFSRYQVSFTEPDLFGRHLDRIGSTVRFSRNFLGFRTHQEERDEFGLSFFKQLDADTRLSLGYRTSAIQVDEPVGRAGGGVARQRRRALPVAPGLRQRARPTRRILGLRFTVRVRRRARQRLRLRVPRRQCGPDGFLLRRTRRQAGLPTEPAGRRDGALR